MVVFFLGAPLRFLLKICLRRRLYCAFGTLHDGPIGWSYPVSSVIVETSMLVFVGNEYEEDLVPAPGMIRSVVVTLGSSSTDGQSLMSGHSADDMEDRL